MTIEIKRGPLPDNFLPIRKRLPFDQLVGEGDHFFVPDSMKIHLRVLRVEVCQYAKKHGMKLSVRKTEGGANVYRVS